MAVTLAAIKGRVQGRLRDNVAKGSTFGTVEYDQAICDAYLYVQSRLPAAAFLNTTGLTIAAGGDTFTLPTTITQYGTASYAGRVVIQLQNTPRTFLHRCTREELDAMRNGSPSVFLAIPTHFCLWEEKDQTVKGRCFPGAQAAQPCDLFVKLSADDLRDYVGSGSSTLENVSVNLSRVGAQALVYHAAAEMLLAMPADEAKRRGINPNVGMAWQKQSLVMLYDEARRHHDLEDVGRTQRWVS